MQSIESFSKRTFFIRRPSLREAEKIVDKQAKTSNRRVICEWETNQGKEISGGIPYFMDEEGKLFLAEDMPKAEKVRIEEMSATKKSPLKNNEIISITAPSKDEIRRITEAQIGNPHAEVAYVWGPDEPIVQVILRPHYSDKDYLSELLTENLVGIDRIVVRQTPAPAAIAKE